eukprot:GFUD01016295.1.p1 GENE.GFUD01016295.1~~GFUD01016295.1.p1  ORF type:complete len:986 (-),score=401.27 GFUD01016295.1:749-3706(-)
MTRVDMDTFVVEQRALLALEREAEVEEVNILQSQTSLKDLCQKGVAVQKVVVAGQVTGLYGRTVITFTSRVVGQELSSHSLTSGDIVGVRGAENAKADLSGVITSVRPTSLAVAFKESGEEVTMDETSLYSLVKLANDITYRRLSSALKYLSTHPCSSLLNVMFSVSTPGVPHQTCNPKLLDHKGNMAFFNSNLDSSQREAVEFCLKQKELGVVHGPPGTGKTTTVVEIIRQAVKMGDKVLVCAPSNVAVDNLVERLVKEKVKVVRLGHPARVSSQLQKHSLDALISSSEEGGLVRDIYRELDQTLARCRKGEARQLRGEVKELRKELKERERKALKEILGRAEVVLGTLTSSSPDSPLKHLPEKHFQLTVIDECSQALETACWIVAGGATKLVLAGDHLQLPPTILSTQAAKGLSLTMMERVVDMYRAEVTRMLTTQYRMNSLIMSWSSQALYSGQLTAAPSVSTHLLSDLPQVTSTEITNTVLLLLDTAGCSMEEMTTKDNISKANEGEAALVCFHVKRLVEQGVNVEDIAVITPYNLQVELLRLNLRPSFPQLEIKSVDGYQGREKEAVVLSLVRSNSKGEVGFLGEKRRLNVAVTRARRHLAVICDSETVKRDKFLGEFVEYLEKEGEVRSASMFTDLPVMQRPEGLMELPVEEKGGKVKLNKEGKVKKVQKNDKQEKAQQSKAKESKKTVSSVTSVSKPVATSVEDAEEDDDRKAEFELIIEQFIKSKEQQFNFSSDLNSYERRLVHELGEENMLVHESVGEGRDRRIRLRKLGDTNVDKLCKKEAADSDVAEESPDQEATEGIPEPTGSLQVVCSTCDRSVPRQNIELHKARCDQVKVNKEEMAGSKGKENKKSKKKKASKPRDSNEDDFDELCEGFQKLDKVCNYPKCKTLVATLGVNCTFCFVRFCLTHSMAEVHGCGQEARRVARQQITREGKLVPGSGLINHKPEQGKRDQLARKLDKKVGNMAGQRKQKEKEKS